MCLSLPGIHLAAQFPLKYMCHFPDPQLQLCHLHQIRYHLQLADQVNPLHVPAYCTMQMLLLQEDYHSDPLFQKQLKLFQQSEPPGAGT